MPQYMLQFSYTSEAWTAMTRNPVDRTETVSGLATSLGGKMISLQYTMGDYDGHVIVDLPDDIAAMAFVLRAIGAGHVRSTKTTRLYTGQEMMEAMKMAGKESYSGPH